MVGFELGFGESGWRASEEFFVVGFELGFGGAVGRGLVVRKCGKRACILNMVVVKLG